MAQKKVNANSAYIKGVLKDERYLITVKNLRSRNFSRNLPFLILSEKLPDGQVYREYPDGRIELQEVFANGPKFESKLIQVLNAPDADLVREEYGLL
ncbi:hypothetical protein ACFFGT_04865 [Mucilaginibacter angelicae]|uniref:Uncharacterized protein n=1 Tax=Mucilaginibacter angelicae TaxID=869718 RepID=A0ABV6L1I3_9SPHI